MPATWERLETARPRREQTVRRATSGSRRIARRMPQAELVETARRLASTETAYVSHPQFVLRNAEAWLAAQRPATLDQPFTGEIKDSTPGLAFVAGLVRDRLLTPPEETYLFLRMNYLKHRVEVLRRRLKPSRPDADLIATIQTALTEAALCRDRIITANLRLVVSVATKLSHSLDHLSELVSEGLIPLIRAVELFDVARGFRFSTYATWAVRNQMVRVLQRQRQSREKSLGEEQPGWDTIPDTRSSSVEVEQHAAQHKVQVARLLTSLSERERLVVSARFGLNGQPTGQSLADIAAELDLSKERVRQIALQALDKLRAAADPQLVEEWGAVDESENAV
jgi:RNA polymerase primary sigma factor